ncbi:amyloid-beta A4 precursor protein-binding family B member 3 isoform X2 [Paralichthys olivaceus]|uniref:amyloid-beta A4 precursor protein-binding family B member 3 isoform X2 n=1 Tax=Paralichthys olivaceus TaxID=8255 RepID=UPI00375148A0
MMGKDYMLAIIIMNYDDNIWTDQNLLLDPDLPSGWRTIKDSTGTYYWHVPTGATQWQHPSLTGMPQPLDAQEEAGGQRPPEDRSSWRHEDYPTNHDPDSKVSSLCGTVLVSQVKPWWLQAQLEEIKHKYTCFAVRSLGWLQVEEEDLSPGRSSLAVSNVIQQLSHCTSPVQRDRLGAWGEGREMMLVLKKDTLTLLDPLDHTPLHCQPIINIRVWGVGCNNGRDFAFVAGDKDTCVLKCHVFRCDAPAKAIATALHQMCSKMMSEKALMRPSRSLTMESISPEDLPRQVEFLDAVQQQVQKFDVQYIGNLPVSRAMGMEVLNRAIESIMNSTDRDDWEPTVIHVTDNVLSLWRGEEGEEPVWECQVRFLTFLGVGHDSHTFAVIVDGGTQRFECHVFWCEPDAGIISEAVQAACMVQYQKCLVAQTPPPRSKSWRANPSKVKRANSMDGAAFAPLTSRYHSSSSSSTMMTQRITKGNGSVRKGMMAFFETFRNKQTATF